jgi:hypothetical protein
VFASVQRPAYLEGVRWPTLMNVYPRSTSTADMLLPGGVGFRARRVTGVLGSFQKASEKLIEKANRGVDDVRSLDGKELFDGSIRPRIEVSGTPGSASQQAGTT